jgi:N-acyl homoserine lactone hydrolase
MYQVDILVQGFPGRAVCHGGLGWSTIALLRAPGRAILIDVGAFGIRRELAKQLKSRGVGPLDITDVVLTHAHYDHAVNFTLFPNATVWIGEAELAWAASEPPGFNPLPELYVRELAASPRVRRIGPGAEFLPGLSSIESPGHTPGHLLYYLTANEVPVLFTGDAAKNRTELLCGHVDLSEDFAASEETLRQIWSIWRKAPGTILVPGHDLSMRLDERGDPQYIGERKAAISAWFAEDLKHTTRIELVPPALKDLAPTGTLRAAINLGNPVLAQRDPATGAAKGVSVDLAHELARRLGVSLQLVTFEAAGKVSESVRAGAWDVAFLAIDPARATEIDFTAPYVLIEGTYLVPRDSPLRAIEDVDREGVRVAVGKGAAYDLYLTRALKKAELVRLSTSAEAIEHFASNKLEAAAGVKQPLVEYARAHPEVRVMEGRFMAIEQAMCTPRGRSAGLSYLRQFIEEMKAGGFVARGLERSGRADAVVAPPAV